MKQQLLCWTVGLAFMATQASADTLMVIKAGEWVRTMSMDATGSGGPSFKVCYKADRTFTEADLNRPIPNTDCKSTPQRSGNIVNVHTVCTSDKMLMTTESVMTVNSNDDFTFVAHTHVENGPPKLPPDMTMTMHWQRTGRCQPGDRPAPE